MSSSLIQNLPDGPLDIVGDVHGEIGALQALLTQLGYDEDGNHSDARRLVFAGDLTDRGPDSPAVVDLVQRLIESGRAQCVLGNHELNILLGDRKHDNHWFYGEEWALDGADEPTPAVLADANLRQRIVNFFRTLPLALEREGLRVVHACWDDASVEIARAADDVIELHNEHRRRIEEELSNAQLDDIDRGLAHQNQNPVKVLSSGWERRIQTPFEASGRLRYEERVPWWECYGDAKLCVFGHYSFYQGVYDSPSKALCVDFGVAKRWAERKQPGFGGAFRATLGCLRLPDNVIVFEDGVTTKPAVQM